MQHLRCAFQAWCELLLKRLQGRSLSEQTVFCQPVTSLLPLLLLTSPKRCSDSLNPSRPSCSYVQGHAAEQDKQRLQAEVERWTKRQ